MAAKSEKKRLVDLDIIVPIIVTVISGFSLIAISIAMSDPFTGDELTFLDLLDKLDLYYVRLQFMWYALGMLLMAGATWVDYSKYKRFVMVFYWIIVGLLVGVRFMSIVNGAIRWYEIGDRGFQPSELAKPIVILVLAKYLSAIEGGIKRVKDYIPVLVLFAIPFGLIFTQPDLGTAMVLAVVFMGMLMIGRVSYKLILPTILLAGGMVVVYWMFFVSPESYVYKRIMAFLDPSLDPLGVGYQVAQAKVAIGSGQLLGKGLFSAGTMSQLNFISEQYTDFIFASIGETFGFVGGIALIFFYLLLLARMLYMSYNVEDKYGSLIIGGVTFMLMAHVFENIGMAIGIMPVTGIPLPFMSYGGSSMWTNMLSLGLVGSVWWRRLRFVQDKMGKTLEFSPEILGEY